jgi:putative transposase
MEFSRMGYPSDLSDAEWALVEHHFKPKDRRGSASKHPRKRVVDAILYVVEGGIKWRMLPKDFPPWQTVYDHFSRWNKAGVWEAALDEINARHRKKSIGHVPRATPSSTRRASRPSTPARSGGSTAASS